MGYITKLDFSSNRQVKQYPETLTVLSGGTSFGVPFSALTTGPDPVTSGITSSIPNVVSTFSGNSSVTVYTWYDNRMNIALSKFSAITPSISGITQNSGLVFTASSTTIIDGNTVALGYTGVSFDITPILVVSLGGGAYSGSVYTVNLDFLSAGTLDFTGRTIWVDVSGITRTNSLIVNNDATFLNIGSQPSTGSLYYTSGGTLTTAVSDKRLKVNVVKIDNALEKILALNGVYYNWHNDSNGNKRLGFIAQDVNNIVPELTFINNNTPEKFMGVHYEDITSLLVEAIKELVINDTFKINTTLTTQTIIAEDNFIELNFNGNHDTSLGGGLIVKKGINENVDAELKIDEDGNWYTNNAIKPKELIIPFYTPISKNDKYGGFGSITRDENYIYIKGNTWKKIKLEEL